MLLKYMGNDEVVRQKRRSAARLPAGPERLMRVLKLAVQDVDTLRLDHAPTPAIAEAHQAFRRAVVIAEASIGGLSESERAASRVAARDVSAMADAMREGQRAELRRPQARAELEVAAVSVEGAERILEEAHEALIIAVRTDWAVWRAALVEEADTRAAAARKAFEKAAAAIEDARATYATVGTLDAQVVRRFPDVAGLVESEARCGLPWYAPTHAALPPLSRVTVPTDSANGKRGVGADMAGVLEALRGALSQGAFALADWCPPDDPHHREMQEQPVAPDATWPRRALIARDGGTYCATCGGLGADVVVEKEGRLALTHVACRPPSEQELKRAARVERERRRGFADQPR